MGARRDPLKLRGNEKKEVMLAMFVVAKKRTDMQ